MQGILTIAVSFLVNASIAVSVMNYRPMTCTPGFDPPPMVNTQPLFDLIDALPTLNQIFGLDVSRLHRSR